MTDPMSAVSMLCLVVGWAGGMATARLIQLDAAARRRNKSKPPRP